MNTSPISSATFLWLATVMSTAAIGQLNQCIFMSEKIIQIIVLKEFVYFLVLFRS